MIYTTADFEGQQAGDCSLLIGVGTVAYRVVVVDRAQQLKFAGRYDAAGAHQEIAALLDLGFGSVKLAVSQSLYTVVPADAYDEQHLDTYRRYLPFDEVGGTELADIAPLRIKLLHQTCRIGMEGLISRFPAAGGYPVAAALLNAVAGYGVQSRGPLLVIERHFPWVTIAVFDAGEFLYCHDFEAGHEDDFTYHLLSVLDQFGLRDRRPTIHIAGEIDQDDVFYQRAAAYGGTVALADSGALTGFRVPPEVVPHQHRFLTLFGLHRCVS